MSFARKILDFFKRKEKVTIGGGTKAIEKQIPVMSTSYSAFDVVGLLYEMGLRG